MGELRNKRHEAFAKELARGQNATAAYAAAGYRVCRQNASRLASFDDIKQRVTELKEKRQTNSNKGRDPETGQFLMGHKSNGGRPRGSRNLLAEKFIADLHDEWAVSGANALKRVAEMDPVAFVKTVASILPSKIDAQLNIDVGLFAEVRDFKEAWRLARTYLGAEDQPIDLRPASENDKDRGDYDHQRGVEDIDPHDRLLDN